MPKQPSWYDPESENSPFLLAMAEARRVCNQAENVMPYARRPRGLMLIEAINTAIDDRAECEMGARDYFYARGHSIGPSRR